MRATNDPTNRIAFDSGSPSLSQAHAYALILFVFLCVFLLLEKFFVWFAIWVFEPTLCAHVFRLQNSSCYPPLALVSRTIIQPSLRFCLFFFVCHVLVGFWFGGGHNNYPSIVFSIASFLNAEPDAQGTELLPVAASPPVSAAAAASAAATAAAAKVWHTKTAAECLAELETCATGLTTARVAEVFARVGPNALAEKPKPTFFERLWDQVRRRDPTAIVLLSSSSFSSASVKVKAEQCGSG